MANPAYQLPPINRGYEDGTLPNLTRMVLRIARSMQLNEPASIVRFNFLMSIRRQYAAIVQARAQLINVQEEALAENRQFGTVTAAEFIQPREPYLQALHVAFTGLGQAVAAYMYHVQNYGLQVSQSEEEPSSDSDDHYRGYGKRHKGNAIGQQ